MRLHIIFIIFINSFLGIAQGWYPKPPCEHSPFFVFHDESGKFGVIDADSNIKIPPIYNDIYIHRTVNDSCGMNDSIAILVGNDGHELVNLKNLQRLKPPGNVQIVHDYIFYQDSLTWGVYDLAFKPLLLNRLGEPMFRTSLYEGFELIDFNSDGIYFYQTEENDENAAWIKENPNNVTSTENIAAYRKIDIDYSTSGKKYAKYIKQLNRNPLKYRSDFKVGLIDITNGKNTKAIYDYMTPVIYNGEIYYWCTRFMKLIYPNRMLPAIGYIDIFNTELERIKRIEFDDFPLELRDYFPMNQILNNNLEKLIIVKSKDKYGAFNTMGKEVVNSDKDSIEAIVSNIYRVTKDKRVTIYNSEGIQLLKGYYSDLKFSFYTYPEIIVQIDSTANSWCVTDLNGNLKHINCSSISYFNGWDSNEHPKNSLKSLSSPKYRCIQDNHYYVTMNDVMIKIDSTNYTFNYPTIGINQYLISTDGEVLFKFDFLRILQNKFYWGRRNNTGFIIKTDGTELIEFEDIYNIGTTNSNNLKITFHDQSIKFFNTIKWEWTNE